MRRAGGRWTLVDLAERSRPPVSTEQVLHPDKWIRVEVPDRVRLPDLAVRLGPRWRRLTGGAVRRVADDGAAGLGRTEAGGRGGGLGRRSLRAVAARRRHAVPRPLRRARRARRALALGHARGRPRVHRALRAALAATRRAHAVAQVRERPRETLLVLAPDAATARQVTD